MKKDNRMQILRWSNCPHEFVCHHIKITNNPQWKFVEYFHPGLVIDYKLKFLRKYLLNAPWYYVPILHNRCSTYLTVWKMNGSFMGIHIFSSVHLFQNFFNWTWMVNGPFYFFLHLLQSIRIISKNLQGLQYSILIFIDQKER